MMLYFVAQPPIWKPLVVNIPALNCCLLVASSLFNNCPSKFRFFCFQKIIIKIAPPFIKTNLMSKNTRIQSPPLNDRFSLSELNDDNDALGVSYRRDSQPMSLALSDDDDERFTLNEKSPLLRNTNHQSKNKQQQKTNMNRSKSVDKFLVNFVLSLSSYLKYNKINNSFFLYIDKKI